MILALHLGGLRVGWASGDPDDTPRSGAWRLGEDRQDRGAVGAAFNSVLRDTYKVMQPKIIVLTSSIGDARTAEDAELAVLQIGLTLLTEVFAWHRNTRMVAVNPDEIRALRLPKSNAPIDDRVGAWCRTRQWEPKSNLAAHALLLWHHAACTVTG